MTTVTVVKKNGRIAIAADTLTKWGGGKESATYVANHEKIIRVGDSFVAVTGSATFKLILADYFDSLDETPQLDSVASIFSVWNTLHGALKEHYYLQTGEDKEEDLESVPHGRADCQPARNFRRGGAPHGAGVFEILCLRQRQSVCPGRDVCSLARTRARCRGGGAAGRGGGGRIS
jgi:hypothetical protein